MDQAGDSTRRFGNKRFQVGNKRSQVGNRRSQVGNKRWQVGNKGGCRLETKETKSAAEITRSKIFKGTKI